MIKEDDSIIRGMSVPTKVVDGEEVYVPIKLEYITMIDLRDGFLWDDFKDKIKDRIGQE